MRGARAGPAWPRAMRADGKEKSRRRPTLARATPALPSAMGPLTSVFGMGTGMAAPPWPPAKRPELETKGNRDPRRDARPISRSSEAEKAKPHAILVPVSSTDRSACTPGLSRSWSTTCLQGLAPRRSCLRGGLALRCFQRLSFPHIATRRCRWRDNRNTRGASFPVLSYWGMFPSNLLRPQRIWTKLSHDVLNPARVPL